MLGLPLMRSWQGSDLHQALFPCLLQRYVQQVQECLAAVPETPATMDRMGQLLQVRPMRCSQHTLSGRCCCCWLGVPQASTDGGLGVLHKIPSCQL